MQSEEKQKTHFSWQNCFSWQNRQISGDIVRVAAVVDELLLGDDAFPVAVHACEHLLHVLYLDLGVCVLTAQVINRISDLENNANYFSCTNCKIFRGQQSSRKKRNAKD